METLTVQPGGRLAGVIAVPGDKSVSHRAVMLGALAEGVTEIRGCLRGEDVRATMNAFRAMGVRVEEPPEGTIRVYGAGVHGLEPPRTALDLGNSGTSMRLLAGILAGCGVPAVLTGDASLCRRPMGRVTEPLIRMGAAIETAPGGCAPIRIGGGRPLVAIDYTLPVASAQVKSAILLAGLYATGRTVVTEPEPTRDHTERMLQGFGVRVRRAGRSVAIDGGQRLIAGLVEVPGDISSAAFFIVGAAIVAGSTVVLRNVGVNPTRTGVIEILGLMGAEIAVEQQRVIAGEPVADLVVRGAPLRGIEIPQRCVAAAIDEFPAIFIAAACAAGTTVLRGARELRFKESDRIETMAAGLRQLGVATTCWDDGLEICGGPLGGGVVDSRGDHRVAMAFAIAALRARAAIEIHDCTPITTSFPEFAAIAARAGLQIERR